MKRGILALLVLVFGVSDLRAQSINVRGLTGFRVGGNVITDQGTMMPRESINYQGVLSYEKASGWYYDFSYMFSPTFSKYKEDLRAPWQQFGTMNVSHYMLGIGYMNIGEGVGMKPFVSFRAGPSTYMSLDNEFNSFTKFTLGLEGGVKIPLVKNFGLITQINMMMPVQFIESELFSSRTRQIRIIPSPGITLVQFAFNAGLYYTIPVK